MSNKPEDLSKDDLESVFSGLGADLQNPNRVKIDQINKEIEELEHRAEYASESYEQPGIRDKISELKAERDRLLGN